MFKIINKVVDFLTHTMPLPSNKGEHYAVMDLLRSGHWILRGGAADYLTVKDGHLEFVEVKLESQRNEPNGGLSKEQDVMRDVLTKHGLKYTVMYVPNLNPMSSVREITHWVNANEIVVNDIIYGLVGKQVTSDLVFDVGENLVSNCSWKKWRAEELLYEFIRSGVLEFNTDMCHLEVSPKTREELRNWPSTREAKISCRKIDSEYLGAMREISKDFQKKNSPPCTEDPIFDHVDGPLSNRLYISPCGLSVRTRDDSRKGKHAKAKKEPYIHG